MKAIVYLVHQTSAFPVGILYNFETFKENNFCSSFYAQNSSKYILLGVLGCSIAGYFYELYSILTRSTGKERVEILSNTIHQNF